MLWMPTHRMPRQQGSKRGRSSSAFFAHPTAIVDEGAVVGAGTRIWHFCHVMAGARIGRDCSLGQNVFVGATAVIGDRVNIQNNVSIYDAVVIEDDAFCGPSAVFTNVLTPRSHVSRRHEFQPTLVRRGATIGANATVVCGHAVGEYAFVGAGAVVTRDVPPHALMLGVPARVAGFMCRCGLRLAVRSGRARCAGCGDAYRKSGGRVERVP